MSENLSPPPSGGDSTSEQVARSWQRLAAPTTRQRVVRILVFGIPGAYLTLTLADLLASIFSESFTLLRVVLVVVFIVVIFGVTYAVLRSRSTTPYVDATARLLRVGQRTISYTDITRAELQYYPPVMHPATALALGTEQHAARCSVVLNDGRGHTLPDEQRELLLDLLAESSVAPPTSSYDPTGKFARYNFPGQLTKHDAIAAVMENTTAKAARPDA